MPIGREELIDAMDSVISVPVIPFRNSMIDYEAHGKNIDYLLDNNCLEGDRRRVIAMAGTSLIHHVDTADQVRLMEFTGDRMAGRGGILISGIAPNPIADAGRVVAAQSNLANPPDAYLLMPISGVCDPEGIYPTFMEFAEKYGGDCGARFLYYLRQPNQASTAARLINDSVHFIGVKVGTDADDVAPLVESIGAGNGLVMWGIGDRSTEPARRGSKGHTSGINVAFVRASDEINNAQRRGDYDSSLKIEKELTALEEIRFRDGRKYNYSAVVEAMHLGAWTDVEGGEGGPFNPRVSPEVAREVEDAISGITHYH
jgi:dihydrodipicolinate synthase/N-acetylneuraminate lyase